MRDEHWTICQVLNGGSIVLSVCVCVCAWACTVVQTNRLEVHACNGHGHEQTDAGSRIYNSIYVYTYRGARREAAKVRGGSIRKFSPCHSVRLLRFINSMRNEVEIGRKHRLDNIEQPARCVYPAKPIQLTGMCRWNTFFLRARSYLKLVLLGRDVYNFQEICVGALFLHLFRLRATNKYSQCNGFRIRLTITSERRQRDFEFKW